MAERTPIKGSERPDLLACLRAVLDEAERVAKAADRPDGNGERWFGMRRLPDVLTYPWGGPTDEYPEEMAQADAAHIIFWSPGVALRMVEATREVLDRHVEVNDGDCLVCVRPQWGYPTHGGALPSAWPCPDVLTEAKRWGVEP